MLFHFMKTVLANSGVNRH